MSSLVRRGRDQYPGANFVFKLGNIAPGKRVLPIDLRYGKEGTQLHYGDIVERHLMNDDIVLLNRQPTLHKQSMMAFRIKVVNDPNLMTFGMSVDKMSQALGTLGAMSTRASSAIARLLKVIFML